MKGERWDMLIQLTDTAFRDHQDLKRDICKRENWDPVLKNVAEYSALLNLRRRWDVGGVFLGIVSGLAVGALTQIVVLCVLATLVPMVCCSLTGRVATRSLPTVRKRLPDPMKPLIDSLLRSRRWRRAGR